MTSFLTGAYRTVLFIIGFFLSLMVCALIVAVFIARCPFQLVSWLLEGVLEGLAALTNLIEEYTT